jgi:anaerobic carbon-monoxide dehydrogenase catalytic subunit
MCCSGAEMMSRHGIPHAGNFMSTEAGSGDRRRGCHGVDVQCIKQALAKVAECYGTPLFTTNPRCRIEGASHIEFHEHKPSECTDELVIKAISRFKNRKADGNSQDHPTWASTGFPTNTSTTCWAAPSGPATPR